MEQADESGAASATKLQQRAHTNACRGMVGIGVAFAAEAGDGKSWIGKFSSIGLGSARYFEILVVRAIGSWAMQV